MNSDITLENQIDLDLKEAMRNRDTVTKLVLRSVKTSLTDLHKPAVDAARVDEGQIYTETILSDEQVLDVIQREAKRRRDAAAEYEKGGRPDRASEELAELAVLERYLPQQLSDDELNKLATEVIAQAGATSMRDMGAVMSQIMPRVEGRADGRRVNQVVRRLLT